MTGKIYGYMRVSTREQNEDRQRIAMREYGVPEENLILDKQSGKDFERPGYLALTEKLKKSRASTVWAGIMTRFWNSGDSLRKRSRYGSLCWICRCWTRERNGTF